MNSTHSLRDEFLVQDLQDFTHVINPNTAYHLSVNSTYECQERRCESSNNYILLSQDLDQCIFKIFCSRLEGNVCGSYSLDVMHQGTMESSCQRGQLITRNLIRNDPLSLKLWYTNDATVDMACYFWCTGDGNIPKQKDEDFNQAMQSHMNSLHNTPAFVEASNYPLPMAFNRVYDLKLNDREDDFHGGWKTYHWYQNATCYATFVCDAMTGNACGDYGLAISNTTQSIHICQPLVMYKLDVATILRISLWKEAHAVYNMSCQFWCSKEPTRSLPQKPPISAETLDLDNKFSSLVCTILFIGTK